MKQIVPACLIAGAIAAAAQAITIWSEDFSSYIDAGITGAGNSGGYPGSVTKWSIDVSNCTLSDAADYFMAVDTGGGRMEAVDIDGEAVWTSESIDISAYTNVSLSVDTSETGSSTSGSKYVRLFYKLNGGTETPFAVNPTNSGNWGTATAVQSNLYGSTLRMIARVNNPNAGDASIFDNVLISGDSALVNLPPVLDFVGNQTVLEAESLSFTVTADDPVDHDPVTFSATNLPTGATFSTNGLFSWSAAAPSGIYSVTFYATDKDGSNSETIAITVIERPKLLISEIADPAGTGGGDYRFVEFYNAGTNFIDLAADNWHLSMQANGAAWSDVSLTGTVAAAKTYVVAVNSTNFSLVYGFDPNQEDSRINGTGNDAFVLYYGGDHTNGTLIDIYGQINTDGTGTAWDYTDSRALRNNDILQPNVTWTASEWTITADATTADMTPGQHGPVPEFVSLINPFVFSGDNLSLTVTAANSVLTNDIITLSATSLPAGATFNTVIGTGTVSSTLNWARPTNGICTASLAAAGTAGTNIAPITITVTNRARIAGYFYGWTGSTVFKLDNGQFWRQLVSTAKKTVAKTDRPYISITNSSGVYYLTYSNSSVAVARVDVTENTVTNAFTGLHYLNVYQLDDGTAWQQVSSENIVSSASPVTAWRWISGGQQMMQFLDRYDAVIGTCTVQSAAPSADTTIRSQIDGWFRGWQNKRTFVLENGQFWQQTSLDSSSQALYNPDVTITNWFQTQWRMSLAGEPGYVEVRQISAVRTSIDGSFYGLGRYNIFKLANGQWWRQTSLDNSASEHSNPMVILWNDNGTDWLELPDQGLCAVATQLNVYQEGTITNVFTGLHYGNLYRLDGAGDWMQVSFENISTNITGPGIMLWTEGSLTNMIVRDSRDVTIGTCTVVDPVVDSDNDGFSNAAEVLAGFDPLDEYSRFELRQTDHYVLSWDATEGRIYTIEWTPSLTESFQTLENNIAWPQNSWTDTVHAVSSEGFYRISVRLAE